METVIHQEKPISSFDQRRNLRSSQNMMAGGLFPPSVSTSYPRRPPLLPLPITRSVSRPPPNQRFDEANLKKPRSFSSPSVNQTRGSHPSQSKIKDVAAVPSGALNQTTLEINLDDRSGTIFSLSPHPSSLPLPKFSIHPKNQCKVEVSEGFDAGATDGLRRLLRLP